MPWGFAIGAAGAIGGSLISSSGANSAAKTSANAANASTALQSRIYDQTTANNAPFLQTGTAALDQLAKSYGIGGTGGTGAIDPNASFYQSPDYQFQLSQGIAGVDAGAAARGQLDSGATRKAEIAYGGNLANSNFNQYATRLQGLAGIGQAAASNQAAAGSNYAGQYTNTVSNAATNAGNAQIYSGNTTANALTGLAGQAQNYLTNPAPNPFSSSYNVATNANGSGEFAGL